jgi:ABC-type enterochelin transport system permease subunit
MIERAAAPTVRTTGGFTDMSRRKPLAALAAITAAVAVAVPAASASAATTERTVSPRQIVTPAPFGAGSLYCDVLVGEIRLAAATGNIWLENGLNAVFVYSPCGGAAI